MAASAPRSYSEFVSAVVEVLDLLAIDYAIVGSLASSIYGEPRLTLDVDLTLHLGPSHVEPLARTLKTEGIFVDEVAVLERLRETNPQPFNMIDPFGGWKADCYFVGKDPYRQTAFARRRQIAYPGAPGGMLWFDAPEDIILSKLVFYNLSNGISTKHLRDIAGMLINLPARGEALDTDYLDRWAAELGVTSVWDELWRAQGESGGNG
jgi:hypothetical protein